MVVHAPSRRGYDYFETQVFNSTIKDNKEMVCLFNGITGEDTHFHPECLIPTGAKVGDLGGTGTRSNRCPVSTRVRLRLNCDCV